MNSENYPFYDSDKNFGLGDLRLVVAMVMTLKFI